ncbi:MAG: hypothetical protein RL710_1143 [Pseudomonadota bacterium]|jgi:hypothetical protein
MVQSLFKICGLMIGLCIGPNSQHRPSILRKQLLKL